MHDRAHYLKNDVIHETGNIHNISQRHRKRPSHGHSQHILQLGKVWTCDFGSVQVYTHRQKILTVLCSSSGSKTFAMAKFLITVNSFSLSLISFLRQAKLAALSC